jgi:hypothetical protein
MASAAVSFRSRCGSVRGAPECSSHTSRIAAPQVGQGTDNVWLGVSSLTFTAIYCNAPTPKNCSILLNQKTLAELKSGGEVAIDFSSIVSKKEHLEPPEFDKIFTIVDVCEEAIDGTTPVGQEGT